MSGQHPVGEAGREPRGEVASQRHVPGRRVRGDDDELEGALVEGVEERDLPRLAQALDVVQHEDARRIRCRDSPRRGRSGAPVARLRERPQQVGLAGARFAPQVEHALGDAGERGAHGRQRLGIAAGNEVLEGGRGRLGEVEEKLPHRDSLGLRRGAGLRRPAWPGRAPRKAGGTR